MMREFFEVLGVTLAIIFGAAIILLGAFALLYVLIDPPSCAARWPGQSEWSFWSGCMVETNRGMIPQDMLTPADIGVVIGGEAAQ